MFSALRSQVAGFFLGGLLCERGKTAPRKNDGTVNNESARFVRKKQNQKVGHVWRRPILSVSGDGQEVTLELVSSLRSQISGLSSQLSALSPQHLGDRCQV